MFIYISYLILYFDLFGHLYFCFHFSFYSLCICIFLYLYICFSFSWKLPNESMYICGLPLFAEKNQACLVSSPFLLSPLLQTCNQAHYLPNYFHRQTRACSTSHLHKDTLIFLCMFIQLPIYEPMFWTVPALKI